MTSFEESWSYAPSDVLNNTYEIVARVGLGGSGEIYRAINRATDREVAIKVLKAQFASNTQFQNLMRREESMREIVHDAVVRYYDLQRADSGGLFLVMEFIEGPSLEDLLKKGPVPADVLVRVARRVLAGLEVAHDKGVYHRDLSPDNIILRQGDPDRATVIDFGIAKAVGGDAKTVIGQGFAGKYEYAAPEQFDGKVDGRTDLYALGATLLAAFRGRFPDLGESHLEILGSKAEKPDLSGVGGELGGLLDRLVEPSPDRRFASAAEALRFLEATRPGDASADVQARLDIADFGRGAASPAAAPESRAAKDGERPPKRRGALIAAVIALVALGGGAALFTVGPGAGWIETMTLPTAAPYEMRIAESADGIEASGHAPGAAARDAFLQELETTLGAPPRGEVALARGMPSEAWLEGAAGLAEAASALEGWSVALSGLDARVDGTAPEPELLSRARSAAEEAAAAAGLTLAFAVDLAPQPLSRARLEQTIETFRNCGSLEAAGEGDIPPGQPIEVRGAVATDADLRDLETALGAEADGRPLRFGVRVLNPAVCVAETLLPASTDGPLAFRLGYGDRSGTAPDNVYHAGENPVIDLAMPADTTDAWVYVFAVDLEGAVFHLLPHVNRPNNRLPELGEVDGEDRVIRLTFPSGEGSPAQLAFEVEPPFGKSMLVAVVSEKPLFTSLRPGSESIEALAEDLVRALSRLESGRYEIARAMLDLRP